MGFLNAFLLAGTLTFAVPVVIHMIFRMRKRQIVFPSLRFLKQSVLKENKRLRLREFLLLLLRCLACILIALAFSRPYRDGQVLAGADGKLREDVVFVIDDSPSMATRLPTRKETGLENYWEAALRFVENHIDEMASDEYAGLVLTSQSARPEVELTQNFTTLRKVLAEKKTSHQRGDWQKALSTAIDHLAESDAPQRRIIFLSDGQKNQLEKGPIVTLAEKNAMRVLPIEVDFKTVVNPKLSDDIRAEKTLHANVAVTAVRALSDVWVDGQPIRFAIRIQNFGEEDVKDLAVRLVEHRENKILAQRVLNLGPSGTAEIELAGIFPRPGAAAGRVEIDARDDLELDDARFFALELRDSLKVLVIEDVLRQEDVFMDQGYFIRMALNPQLGEGSSSVSSVTVQKASARNLSKVEVEKADVLFLVGLEEIPSPALTLLEQAAKKGKSFVIFAGTTSGQGKLSEAFYKGKFFNNGEGLFPAQLGSLVEMDPALNEFQTLQTFDLKHPLFKPFEGQLEAELKKPKFFKFYKLIENQKEDADTKSKTFKVLARFDDGSPFVVESSKTFEGKTSRIFAFPFCPRPEHTTLPTRKVFVAMMHQLVRYLAGPDQSADRMVNLGADIDLSSLELKPHASISLVRPLPFNDKVELTVKDPAPAPVRGVYEVQFKKLGRAQNAYFAANLDPAESDLKAEEASTMQTLWASNSKTADENRELGVKHLDEAQAEKRKRQAPDWRYYLLAAVVCLGLEVFLRDFWTR